MHARHARCSATIILQTPRDIVQPSSKFRCLAATMIKRRGRRLISSKNTQSFPSFFFFLFFFLSCRRKSSFQRTHRLLTASCTRVLAANTFLEIQGWTKWKNLSFWEGVENSSFFFRREPKTFRSSFLDFSRDRFEFWGKGIYRLSEIVTSFFWWRCKSFDRIEKFPRNYAPQKFAPVKAAWRERKREREVEKVPG